MKQFHVGLGSLLLVPVAILILNMELGTETVVQAYYSYEPLRYEETFVREGTTTKWHWGWPPRVTVPQVEYGLKNIDAMEGGFLVNVVFTNDIERKNGHRRITLEPGQEETVIFDSPIQGPQSFDVSVEPSFKRVQRQREVEVHYKVYDKIWQLKDLIVLSRAR